MTRESVCDRFWETTDMSIDERLQASGHRFRDAFPGPEQPAVPNWTERIGLDPPALIELARDPDPAPRRWRRWLPVAAAIVLLGAGAGTFAIVGDHRESSQPIASSPSPSLPPAPTDSSLLLGTWKLQTVRRVGNTADTRGYTPGSVYLSRVNGAYHFNGTFPGGSPYCGSEEGTFTLDGDQVAFHNERAVLIGCMAGDGYASPMDELFFDPSATWRVDGTTLRLSTDRVFTTWSRG
jgi:hypothetical protein